MKKNFMNITYNLHNKKKYIYFLKNTLKEKKKGLCDNGGLCFNKIYFIENCQINLTKNNKYAIILSFSFKEDTSNIFISIRVLLDLY